MVVDMPHNTYRNSKEALKNAKKIILNTKCDAVKLEGGKKIYKIVNYLTKNNIPVMGHLGLLPQSDKTFKFKGKKFLRETKF
jgi:3-methyl-2-oxobutanoate hydroxymethyltransferase